MTQLKLASSLPSSHYRGQQSQTTSIISSITTPETMRPQTAASNSGSANGSSESVKVIVRCRPLSSTEIKQGHEG